MHLPSESLNGAICPVTAVVAAGTIVLAAYTLKKNKLKRPTAWQFALTTVAVFALQALNYALPAGFSGHMLGAVFAATILGVPAAILSVALVITVQCLAFNDGGTLQLGANILNMAVVATGIGGLVINRLGYINKNVSIALGATLSIMAAVGLIAVELTVGGIPDGALIRTLLVSHIPIALIEGSLTVALVNVQNVPVWKDERKIGYALAAIMLIAFVISPFASTLPDALEAALGK